MFQAIRTKAEFKNNVSYKLINLLNFCDLLQSSCQILTGVFIVFPVFAIKIDPFVTGYTLNTLWLASFVIIAVLSMTRLAVTFCNFKANRWTLWMKIILFIGGLYIFTIWILGCVTLNFRLDGVAWAYDPNAPFVDILGPMEIYFCFPIMVFNFISFILILGNIYKKKQGSQSSSSFRTEISLLTQTIVLTTYMATIMLLWHNGDSWFKMTNIAVALLNGSWIMFSHLNALLLIITNRTVRRQVALLLCGSCTTPRTHTTFFKTSNVTDMGRLSTIVQ
uniref:7TM_GPCR_Srx domain-containing protein n=1 Tax=Caenorhabditis tropicalis TaxID=1561998 RepID=A0A1I7SZR2_9PELO